MKFIFGIIVGVVVCLGVYSYAQTEPGVFRNCRGFESCFHKDVSEKLDTIIRRLP